MKNTKLNDKTRDPYLIIFRGLPGSGKSTKARQIAEEIGGALVIEPDALLIRRGRYEYTHERYQEAVKNSLSMVCLAGIMSCDLIYADVLPRHEDVMAVIRMYRDGAWYADRDRHAFTLRVISQEISVDESLEANRHNVAEEDIRRMYRDWEEWNGEEEEVR